MLLRRFAFAILSIVLAAGGIARADDLDTVRTMLGLASLPNAQARDAYVGTLPKGMLFVPQPTGLTLLGSVAAASTDGKLTAEVLFYGAPAGSVPDLAGYAQQLASAGWNLYAPGGIPALPFAYTPALAAYPRTFCKTGGLTITVHPDHEYLVVQASTVGGLCASTLARRITPTISKAPYPMFSPPDGSMFVGSSKQTFSGSAHVASIGLVSNQSAAALLTPLAKQMTDAGWKIKTVAASAPDSEAFSIRDTDGIDWIAALSLVQVGSGMYLFTASAFKLSETVNHTVSTR
ncbi:MAG: hypothetical protein WBD74_08650 [Candidatus Aquilonibacter sp.]